MSLMAQRTLLASRAASNLITNGSFEVDVTGWQTDGINTFASSTTISLYGGKSGKATFVTGGDRYRLAEYPVTLPAAGAFYIFSAYVWIPAAYNGLAVHIRTSNFTGVAQTLGYASMGKRDQWQRVVTQFAVGADVSGELRVSEDNAAVQNADFIYIDGVKLEKGFYPTAFAS